MRKFLAFIAVLLTLAVISGAVIFVWAYNSFYQPGPMDKAGLFMVERGKSIQAIANDLGKAGIIKEPLLFQIVVRIGNKTLKAGEYQIPPQASMASVLAMIVNGDIYQRQITIPEGLTSWQIVQLLNKAQELSGPAVTQIPAEGSLLPETYSYSKGDTRQDILDRMHQAMQETLTSLWEARQEALPLKTQEEALALAAIVEKETGFAGERARIAGVFINRLERGMPLQSDPTVIYALTEGKVQSEGRGPIGRRLLRGDLDTASPYNTYKNPGLPPGPIANPGRDAIAATLHPEEHDYIYFVADGTGGHVFAKTLDQHNRNAAKWRKIRKEKGL